MAYVAVAKALYDYAAQDADTELSFAEDQILYIIDKEDDDWWKCKLKHEAGISEGGVGLVPASYVEEIPPISTSRAMFAYDSTSPEELSMSDDSGLHVFSVEEEWLLVQLDSDPSGKLGFVPRNYCEPLDTSEQVEVADAADAEAELESQRQAEKEREHEEKKRQLKLKDKVETWSVSELDGKKKKKGTLGVGNAAVFFASDTDKAAPVKQFPITELVSVSQSSAKTLSLQLTSQVLDLHCGSSDTAQAILAKLEGSKAAAGEALELLEDEQAASTDEERELSPAPTPTSAPLGRTMPPAPKGVRFAPEPTTETATALYDFDAAGDDELSVQEGTVITILDKENDEWWLVKDSQGQQGVVPAAYLQLNDGSAPAAVEAHNEEEREDERAAQKEREARAAAMLQADRERQLATEEEERRRIQAAAEERRRQEDEDRQLALQIEDEQRERAARKASRRQEEERRKREEETQRAREQARAGGLRPPEVGKRPSGDDVAKVARNLPARSNAAPARPPDNARPKPNPSKIRVWSDKSGQFNVEAEYIGLVNNKVRLHKLNGVIIDVPLEKMSGRDSELIRRHEAKRAKMASMDEDDRPLGGQPPSRAPGQRSMETTRRTEEPVPADVARASKASANRRPPFDWFEFFLSAGCDMDDCTRYASSFERDRIDDTILSDLDHGTLRSLGLREGDVIRVRKTIQARFAKKTPDQEKQIQADEEYARQLQEYEKNGSKGPAPTAPPGLFTGADGKLANNTRRGRPEKKSTGPESVDPAALAAATDKLNKVALTPAPPPAPTPPPVTISPPPIQEKKATLGGFDDDAWTIKPTSKPASPAPATITTSPPPAPAPPVAPSPASPKVANTTDSLLAQINSLRPASTGMSQNNTGGSFDRLSGMVGSSGQYQQQQQPLQPQQTAQPQQFQPNAYGLGVQNGGQPMSVLAQQTGMSSMSNGARGPLAPIAANQGLLQPMQSQTTGMFVPTRVGGSPLGAQQTGYQQGMLSQPTGFQQQQQQSMMPQQTGYGGNQMGMQPSYTGFPGMQPQQTSTFNAIASIPPPQTQQSSQAPDKFAPSNIFAAMKTTDFGKPEGQQPQISNKYDALRPLTTGYNGAPGGGMMPQQTGMYPQQTGMQGMMPQQSGMPMQGMGGMMPQMTGYHQNMMYQQQGQGGYGYQ